LARLLQAEFTQIKGDLSSGAKNVAIGELPIVDLTEAGPAVLLGSGTGYAAAVLAAIAVESIARQPTLKGGALRDALIKAAHAVDAENPPVARVVIPR
jgi:protein-L-isoaspartate O-methyltransferase